MAAITTAVAVAGVAVAAAGTVAAVYQGKKAQKAQKEASQEQRRRDAVIAKQQQMQNLREAQVERARIIAAGQGTGAGLGSSGTQGGVASTGAIASSNMAFTDQLTAFNNNISRSLQSAATAQGRAQTFSGVAGLGMSAFSASGESFSSLEDKLFG